MSNKNLKKSHFTLVELLAAMAVFSILLMVSMQIFGNSQKLWVSSEQKNNAFASARAAMEFVAARVQTHAYSEDMPFYIEKNGARMYFPTAMPMNRKKDNGSERDRFSLRFVGFSVNDNGVLQMSIYSDEGNGAFLRNTPPYRNRTYEKACENVRKNTVELANTSENEHNFVEIAENVVDFKLIGYTLDSGTGGEIKRVDSSEDVNTPPYLLVIQLSVIDSKANFDEWKKASGDAKSEIFQEHGYTFQRAVVLRQRSVK